MSNLGFFNHFIHHLEISEVQSVNKEVKKGSDTTISCVITEITATATVSWRTSSGEVSGDNFTPDQGSYSDGKHASTLTVKGTQVTADTAYTCRVTSGPLPDSGYWDTSVNLNVYGKFQDRAQVHYIKQLSAPKSYFHSILNLESFCPTWVC